MMKGLLVAYCDKKQVEYGDIQFLYEGKRLPMGMKDGDEIEAFMNVQGGALLAI
nr:small ubiquitin-related modifier 1-like [Ipomoea batatas]GMD66182.1 small ubiquitin-related modifier 1-like [Ipomoea batatas]GMD68415.1 small ubiquitin-related modifier 1-like [Ipomoea batatas]GMD79709.1 small ubiquitin-related modifier 1-like [Ipomoea batatas]